MEYKVKYIKTNNKKMNEINRLKCFFIGNVSHLFLLFAFSGLIVGGLYYRPIMLFAVFVISIYLILSPCSSNVADLFFLLEFENIFKLSSGSSSMFTFLQIIPIIKIFLIKPKKVVKRKSIVLTIVLIGYCLMFSYTTLTGMVKFCIGLSLLFLAFAKDETTFIDTTQIVLIYSFGIIISSIWALTQLPELDRYTSSVIVRLYDGSAITRFSGLWKNANYYSMEISFALAALAILYLRNRIKYEFIIMGLLLFIFGCMSQSKTFILTFVIDATIFFFYFAKKSSSTMIRFIIGCLCLYVVFYNRINHFLLTYFSRMNELVDESTTLAVATTGRSDIWNRYLYDITKDISHFLFGRGMETGIANYSDPHNMFIELLYTIGIVGTILYFITIFSYRSIRIDSRFSIIILLAFILRAFAANIAYYNNTWYYYALIFSILDDRPYESLSNYKHHITKCQYFKEYCNNKNR